VDDFSKAPPPPVPGTSPKCTYEIEPFGALHVHLGEDWRGAQGAMNASGDHHCPPHSSGVSIAGSPVGPQLDGSNWT
jgi:hypothetical protein